MTHPCQRQSAVKVGPEPAGTNDDFCFPHRLSPVNLTRFPPSAAAACCVFSFSSSPLPFNTLSIHIMSLPLSRSFPRSLVRSYGTVQGPASTAIPNRIPNALAEAVTAAAPRTSWTKEEVAQVYNTPLNLLTHASVSENTTDQYDIEFGICGCGENMILTLRSKLSTDDSMIHPPSRCVH